MSVTLNPNAQWSNYITQALQSAGFESAEVTAATVGTDGNLTVTLKDASGVSQSMTFTPPTLDTSTDTLSAADVATLATKLSTTFADLKKAIDEGSKIPPETAKGADGGTKVLFDIYALMQLMLEIGKQEREAARHTRDAELQRSVADVKNRADEIREGAKTALIMSVAFSVASIAAQAVSAGVSAKAPGTAAKMESASGVAEAQQNLSLLSAKNGDEAAANLAKIDKSMTPEQMQLSQEFFQDTTKPKVALAEKRTQLTKAEQKLTSAQAECDAAAQNLGGNVENVDGRIASAEELLNAHDSIPALEQKVQSCEAEYNESLQQYNNVAGDARAEKIADRNIASKQGALDTARAELAAAKAKVGDATPEQITETRQNLTALQSYKEASGRLTTAQADVKEAQTNVTKAENAYAESLNLGQNRLEATLSEKRLQLSQCEQHGGKIELDGRQVTSSELKTEIKNLEAARQRGKAFVVNEKMGEDLKASLNEDFQTAERVFGQKSQLLEHDAQYRKAIVASKGWETAGNMFKQVGDMLNNLTQQLNAMRQASATEYEAMQKTDEAAREESNDLAASAQQLVKAVLDLLQAVQAAENQSIQRIMA